MPLISRLLRWTATPVGRRVLFLATTVVALAVACNPELLPLLPVVDVLGLDVLVMLMGAQFVATLPWLRRHGGNSLRLGCRAFAGIAAGAMGGYLRQLVFGIAGGTVRLGRAS